VPMDRGTALLGAQFVCIAGIVITIGGPVWALPDWGRAVCWVGVVAGTLMMLVAGGMLGLRLRAHPAPADGARLRSSGAYGLTRHPIYLGLLTAMGGLAILRERVLPLVAFAALALVLHVKADYEEGLLLARFGEDYEEYRRRVPRLLPFPRPRTSDG
jgi:protein-S-isoprenylcysteine O-methyltransferase Ste14